MNKVHSIYIHFPYCRHLCNYCDFYKNIKDPADRDFQFYHNYLEESFQKHKKFMNENRYSFGTISTLYIGGGTPSMWGAEGARFLNNFFKKNGLSFSNSIEFTVEFNPGNWNVEKLKAWLEIGANRFSLGIQSYNDQFLKILDRVHRVKEVKETLAEFSSRKINFNVDFMLGLPHSKRFKRNILQELDGILEYSPKHISLYILTVKKQYPEYSQLPNDLWISEEYKTVSKYLRERGFEHYEVSNFAKPNFLSKHNMHYWKSNSVAAFGPSATGLLVNDSVGRRYKWKASSADFEVENLNEEALTLEKLYLGLRTSIGVKFCDYADTILPKKFFALAIDWQNKGYVERLDDTGVILSPNGYIILDSLMDEIFLIENIV